jgi:ribosome-associated protein
MHKKKKVISSPLHATSASEMLFPAQIQSFLEDHKIFEVTIIDLKGKSTIADTMIIASGRSQKHISVIAELLRDYLKQKAIKFISIEGLPSSDWILLDAGDIIIHLFKPETRALYNLEKMWGANIKIAGQDDVSSHQ